MPTNNSRIVIEERQILNEICGFNDVHLNLIQDLLGAPVYSLGNELHIKAPSLAVKERFHSLVEQMSSLVRKGFPLGPDLIRSLGEGGAEQEALDLEDYAIEIPQGGKRVYPRGYAQAHFIRGMRESSIAFGIGPAGTGKTHLAIAQALKEVLGRKKRKIILTRPVVEAGENLGFLPGDLAQKISPYLRPLYDAMEDLLPPDILAKLEENRMIEIAPLAYMRGRSLKNCFIVLDEAQNTTGSQMKMFLTRIGEGAQAVITGDSSQVDLPHHQESGLVQAQNILSSIKEIHFTYFTKQDVVRNPLIKKIIDAYENHR